MTMLFRICNSCNSKVEQGKRCSCRQQITKERHREYDRVKRNKEAAEIYHSKRWKAVAAECRLRCNGLDLYAFYVEKKIVPGRIVHHIEGVSESPELVYCLDNLICVSHGSHNKIEAAYRAGENKKNKMKKILRDCLERHGGG